MAIGFGSSFDIDDYQDFKNEFDLNSIIDKSIDCNYTFKISKNKKYYKFSFFFNNKMYNIMDNINFDNNTDIELLYNEITTTVYNYSNNIKNINFNDLNNIKKVLKNAYL